MLRSRTRKRTVVLRVAGDEPLSALARPVAGLTFGHVVDGNAVTIVQNSAFFDALLADVAAARSSVHLETFLWQDGEVSDRIVETFAAAARRGVEVRVLVDQRGAMKTDPASWAALREAGVDFRVYHRTRVREMAWVNHRTHRKIAVIDGAIGYTFGHGMADMWGPAGDADGWRDTAARLTGPVVNSLQAAFFENWTKVTREALVTNRYFPELAPAGTTQVHVAHLAPPETSSAVQRLYYIAIAAARREVILQNPYFIPDRQAIALCRSATRRGVRIEIMLPTSVTSDFPIVQHASHHYYGALLAAGVRIWEFERCGLHQKVMIVDGEWCSLGSTNFDPRSFNINDEITVAIYDTAIAGELRRAFEDDRIHAREWTMSRWKERSLTHRAIDRASSLFRRQL